MAKKQDKEFQTSLDKKTSVGKTEKKGKVLGADFVNKLFKKTGHEIPAIEHLEEPPTNYTNLGSYSLNALVCASMFGGLPHDCITALAGEEATGKTYIALNVVKNFLDAHPNGHAFYYESERAINKGMIDQRKIDTERFHLERVDTVEQFRYLVVNLVNEYLEAPVEERIPFIIVLDSLGNLSTIKEMAESAKTIDKAVTDMTRARAIKGVFRVLSIKLGAAQIPLLITNHVSVEIGKRTKPGMPTPKTMTGGSGLKYAASTIIMLSKTRVYNAEKSVIGNILTAKLYKSRLTREGLRATMMLDHTNGIDPYYGLFDLAKMYGIVTKDGNGFRFPDGRFVHTKTVNDEPAGYFTDDVLKLLEEKISVAFRYGGESVAVVADQVIADPDIATDEEDNQ